MLPGFKNREHVFLLTEIYRTRRQQAHIDSAREWYAALQRGDGTPLNHVPYIREELQAAKVDASVLDPTGQRAAADIDRELDEAFARGEQTRLEAWRELESRYKIGTRPGRIPGGSR